MSQPKRYTITSALPYANGPLHIGHLAGAYLNADIFVRFLRSCGEDVLYVCGSDEHGAAITLRAKKEGKKPQEIVDEYHNMIKESFENFGIDFDIYHRTSSPEHHENAQAYFKTLNEKGVFTQEKTQQYFDEEYQQFLADRYIKGTCPNCGFENAYGDQCESCGKDLSPMDLIHPVSTLSEKKPVVKETSHWFLPMNRHEDWLNEWINNGSIEGKALHDPKAWKKHVLGQCNSWINNGLQARAMTRDLNWGVSVPVEGNDGKVLYVWLDAPIGYISATQKWASKHDKNWEDYWKSKDTELIHFIGKDNIVFHCIIFPILLKTHGEYILPKNVPANAFLNLEGDKISTSRNWAVWLHEYLEDFPDQQDVLRYVLTSIAPENKDSEFTWRDFQERNNNELVAIFGNFINRTLVLTNKYYDGKAPAAGNLEKIDEDLIRELGNYPEKISSLLKKYRFKEAQVEMMNVARAGNKYLADTEPWKLIKTDPERVKTVMNLALQLSAKLAVLATPFLPQTSKKLFKLLGLQPMIWEYATSDNLIESGHKIAEKPSLLFSKVEDETIEKQREKLQKNQPAMNNGLPALKPTIEFDQFAGLDLRVAEIIEAEKIPKTDKLLKLTVNTGADTRIVLSGIAEFFSPDDIIGKQVCLLANLAPRKIRGVESQGMILMAEDTEGNLEFVNPTKPLVPGSVIR